MTRGRIALFVLVVTLCLPWLGIAAEPQLAHMVYFQLKERTVKGQDKLIAACQQYLSGHEGTVYFSVGALAKDLDREVNDRGFDVALNLVFRNKAAHDAYLTHPRHLKFIAENRKDWSGVRVFDSYLAVSGKVGKAAKRLEIPQPATAFAGMLHGVVVDKRAGQLVMEVGKVTREWKHSKAKDATALVGQQVAVQAGKHEPIRRFVDQVKLGESIALDVAHKEGDVLVILELTPDQRERVKP